MLAAVPAVSAGGGEAGLEEEEAEGQGDLNPPHHTAANNQRDITIIGI